MNSAFQPELIAIVPWDDEGCGVPSAFHEHPRYGFVVSEQLREVRAPVRVRLDHDGGYHLLGEVGGIVHLDSGGTVVGRTPLAARGDVVRDYVCASAGECTLLEQTSGADGPPLNRLRALDPQGAEIWSRTGPVHATDLDLAELRGTFSRVLLDALGRVFLTGGHGSQTAEIDPVTGSVRRIVRLRRDSGVPFLAGGRLLSVFYDDEANRRGVAVKDPDGNDDGEWLGTDEHFAWLVHPFGADGQARVYVWRDGRIARIDPGGEIQSLIALDGIAVQADAGRIFTSYADADGVWVSGEDGRVGLGAPAGYRLVHVDEEGRYHLLGGEEPGRAGVLRVYSAAGELVATTPASADLLTAESVVPPHDAWQVDDLGRIVIPVVTPEGVALVRLREP